MGKCELFSYWKRRWLLVVSPVFLANRAVQNKCNFQERKLKTRAVKHSTAVFSGSLRQLLWGPKKKKKKYSCGLPTAAWSFFKTCRFSSVSLPVLPASQPSYVSKPCLAPSCQDGAVALFPLPITCSAPSVWDQSIVGNNPRAVAQSCPGSSGGSWCRMCVFCVSVAANTALTHLSPVGSASLVGNHPDCFEHTLVFSETLFSSETFLFQ